MKRVETKSAADTRVAVHHIGSIGLVDLDIISRSYGRDFLPYPFMLTRPPGFALHHEYVSYARSVVDSFNHGDLRIFRRWAASYAHADIRVECRVQYIPADTPSIRVVGNRRGALSFLARQRPEEDVIDVYELSPYDLGPAVARMVDLVKPGKRSEIVIPEYVPSSGSAYSADNFTVRHAVESAAATEVRRADVAAFGTVQSHWRPTRRWGLDRGKNAAVLVRIRDDGDYLFEVDMSVARPLRRPRLAERINELIAEDVAVLRDFRDT